MEIPRPNGAPATHAPAEHEAIAPVAIGVALLLALQFHLVLTRTINWDEFHYLHQVAQFSREELASPLQTIHVRFFAWLIELELPGVDQIIGGRVLMFAAELITCISIALIAQRFVPWAHALLCVLAYLSVGYVFQHGFAFRADPLAASLAMASLTILTRARLNWFSLAGFGLLLALAFMVTIKSILLAPAFIGIAWLRWSEDNFSFSRALRLTSAAIVALVAATLLYLWHGLDLAPSQGASTMLGRSGQAMFFIGLPDNWRFIVMAVLYGTPFFLVLALLPWALLAKRIFSRHECIALGFMALPLASVFFYYNTYPYFYAFILAPVAVALAGALPRLARRYGAFKLAIPFAAAGAVIWSLDDKSRLNEQRAIQVAVDEMFPEPVNYFDFPGFFPNHRKANFFMTRWGFRNYAQGTAHSFREIMAEKPVPLLAAIDPEISPRLIGLMQGEENGPFFHPQDRKALTSTYRQVWGPIYVAGIVLEAGEQTAWNVLVPGTYTIDGSLSLDDVNYQPGELVELERGIINLSADDSGKAGLLWGANTAIPDYPAPDRPYWTRF